MVTSIEAGDRAGLLSRRDALVVAHAGLVPPMAWAIAATLPASFEADDLIGVGYLALLTAATRFRPAEFSRPGYRDAEIPFASYARPRIRGAMIDSVRRRNWVENMRPSLSLITDVGFLTYEEKQAAGNRSARLRQCAPRCEGHQVEKLMLAERRQKVRAAMARLPERWRALLDWHYDDELSMAEVGRRLGITGTRASQIHMEAIRSLRRALAA